MSEKINNHNGNGELPHKEILRGRGRKAAMGEAAGDEKDPGLSNDPEKVARAAISNTRKLTVKKAAHLSPDEREGLQRKEAKEKAKHGPNNKELMVEASEPLMVQVLGVQDSTDPLITSRFSRAIWATDYDDFFNATDIIYEIESPFGKDVGGRKILTLSVDVTTAVTDNINKGVKEKFDEAGFHRETDIQWTQEIACCGWRNKECRSEGNAPHFILGLSKDTFKKIAQCYNVDKNGFLVGGQVDEDIQFMIASEFYEELRMQIAFVPKSDIHGQLAKLKDLEKVMLQKLARLLGFESSYDPKEFHSKYEQKAREMAAQDKVYLKTVNEARSIRKSIK